MTIADLCILVAFLLPYVTSAYAKYLTKGAFNNADPRNEEFSKINLSVPTMLT
jgi:uncharacterized MAPEG superfamily protein